MQNWELKKVSDIPNFEPSYKLVCHAVCRKGGALFLYVESDGANEVCADYATGVAAFPNTKMDKGYNFRLVHILHENHIIYDIEDLNITFPLVDLFPNGRLLIAGSRCEWRSEDDYDLNGVIIDTHNNTKSHIVLGDGIEQVFIDDLSRIWVSYSDEGVYGNYGWGVPGPDPIGSSGLNCFDQNGSILWKNQNLDIADCYALNVSGNEVYIYFYEDFPLCHISQEFNIKYWKTPLKGCHQLAIYRNSVLFSGQYDDPRSIVYFSNIEETSITRPQKIELCFPDGSPINGGKLIARGHRMHFFDENGWFQFCLDDVHK